MTHDETESESIWHDRRSRVGICLLLGVAFSPIILDLSVHLRDQPWARPALLFPWLAWVAACLEEPRQPGSNVTLVVWGVVAVSLLIEIVSVAGNAVRLGRLALPIAAIGIVWGARWASATSALILVWMVPLPNMLLSLGSPALETMLARLGSVVAGVGVELVDDLPVWVAGGARLPLGALEGGAALLWGMAGIGWFRAAVSGAGLVGAMRRALYWMLMGIPLQLVILGLAATILRASQDAAVGRLVLDHAGWILITALGLAASVLVLRRDTRREAAC